MRRRGPGGRRPRRRSNAGSSGRGWREPQTSRGVTTVVPLIGIDHAVWHIWPASHGWQSLGGETDHRWADDLGIGPHIMTNPWRVVIMGTDGEFWCREWPTACSTRGIRADDRVCYLRSAHGARHPRRTLRRRRRPRLRPPTRHHRRRTANRRARFVPSPPVHTPRSPGRRFVAGGRGRSGTIVVEV